MDFSDSQDPDVKEKNKDFLSEYSSTSAVFLVEILMEEIELVEADN